MIKHIGNYIFKDIGGTIVAQSPMFLNFPKVVHYFTTRVISDENKINELGELNMGVSDENFPKHFEYFAKLSNIDSQRCVFSHQVHGKNIKVITSEDVGKPYWDRKLKDTDGLITKEKGLFLVTTYADCMPILVYDPLNGVIGVAHSGWRGTLHEIAKELVLKINEEFGSKPGDVFVSVGPSIGPESFAVGEEIAAEFLVKFGKEVVRQEKEKLYVDLWKAVKLMLNSIGVEHIEFSQIDTYRCTSYFYSYRKEATKKRFAAVIGMLE
ncbi:MAG: peptidoglycan editing factor PgeF [Fervidobacterium sp.]